MHATLVHTALRVYELLVEPLSSIERDAYYDESKLFALLFGIPDDVLPPTWEAFERYFDGSDVGLTQNGEDIDAISVDADGDVFAFARLVQRAIDVLPHDVTIVSGHGNVGKWADLDGFIDMLRGTEAWVRERLAP